MSALPAGPDPIADQDHTHGWIRALLEAVTSAVLETQPGLMAFGDHRPERDRPSGGAWRGLETMCHVSALLASALTWHIVSRPPHATRSHGLVREDIWA